MSKENNLKKLSYQEFVCFMKRYELDSKKKNKKESHKSPYQYKRVFNKD